MNIVKDFPLRIDLDTVLRGQGADPERARQRPHVVRLYEEALREAAALVQPVIGYELYPVRQVDHAAILLDGGKAIRSKLVAELLASAKEIGLVVVTIGSLLDQRVSAYFAQQQSAKAVALDGVGVAAMESLVDECQSIMEAEAARRGLKASIPLSPGMNELCSLDEQWVIFDLLPTREIGVSLTSGAMMMPVKSASMIFGFGSGMLTRESGSQCDFCSRRDTCGHRKPTRRTETSSATL